MSEQSGDGKGAPPLPGEQEEKELTVEDDEKLGRHIADIEGAEYLPTFQDNRVPALTSGHCRAVKIPMEAFCKYLGFEPSHCIVIVEMRVGGLEGSLQSFHAPVWFENRITVAEVEQEE